eukprot:1157198-Pelagomonas_calceolata.AAC.9
MQAHPAGPCLVSELHPLDYGQQSHSIGYWITHDMLLMFFLWKKCERAGSSRPCKPHPAGPCRVSNLHPIGILWSTNTHILAAHAPLCCRMHTQAPAGHAGLTCMPQISHHRHTHTLLACSVLPHMSFFDSACAVPSRPRKAHPAGPSGASGAKEEGGEEGVVAPNAFRGIFAKDLRVMQYGYGDDESPLQETVGGWVGVQTNHGAPGDESEDDLRRLLT